MDSQTTNTTVINIQRELEDGRVQTGRQTTTVTTTNKNVGDRVTDVSILPFARVRPLLLTGENLRPDTNHQIIFNTVPLTVLDEEIFFSNLVINGEATGLTLNLDQWKGDTITDSGADPSRQTLQFVKTDANGFFQCGILVPENTPWGDSTIEAESVELHYFGVGGKESRGNVTYRALGLNQTVEPTIVSTQVIEVRDNWDEPPPPPEDPPEPEVEVGSGCILVPVEFGTEGYIRELNLDPREWGGSVIPGTSNPRRYQLCPRPPGQVDPLAQSFTTLNKPVYVTSIDLFFRAKAESGPGVTVMIREMINGFPGPRIVPTSQVTLTPDQINVSDDSSVATNFAFSDPVLLESNTQYCFVVLAFSTEYEVWTSTLGEQDVLRNVIVDIQPYRGSMFTSQNNTTWTPEQQKDIKFNIYKGNFTTDGVNESVELPPMTGADAFLTIQKVSQFLLGSAQLVHPDTDIKWYYRFDRTEEGPSGASLEITEWKLFEPGINMDLENLTTKVFLKFEFSGQTLTPVIDLHRASIFFLKNKTNGTYITRTFPLTGIEPESLRPNYVRVLFNYKAPTNTRIICYAAINEDLDDQKSINWHKLTQITANGGEVFDASSTFTVNAASNTLILDDSTIGFYTGQLVTFSGLTGAAAGGSQLGGAGAYYVRVDALDRVRVYPSQTDAEDDTNEIVLTGDGNTGTITRTSNTEYSQVVMGDGWAEAQFATNFSGLLESYGDIGINEFKFKIELEVDEGFESKTPLVEQLRILPTKR